MNSIWMGLGFVGQAVFGGRFFVQWIASERAGHSVIPRLFWYMSIVGSAILLAYAINKRDPVFILGQSLGFAVYIRNLYLVRRDETRGEVSRASG